VTENHSQFSLDLLTRRLRSKELAKGRFLWSKKAVNLTFQKVTAPTYFILAGIVKDDKIYETKVTYKKTPDLNSESLQNEKEITDHLKSTCLCHNWTKEFHCEHIVALIYAFSAHVHHDNLDMMSHPSSSSLTYTENSNAIFAQSKSPFFDEADHQRWGFYFSSMPHNEQWGQYFDLYKRHSSGQSDVAKITDTNLTKENHVEDSKVFEFPFWENFQGHLFINFNQLNSSPKDPNYFFTWKKDNLSSINSIENFESENLNTEVKSITLGGINYLFNWELKKVYQLPEKLKNLLWNIKNWPVPFTVNEALVLHSTLPKNHDIPITFRFQNKDFENFKNLSNITETQFKISIHPQKDQNLAQLQLCLSSPQNLNILKALTFENGLLSGLYKKNDWPGLFQQIHFLLNSDLQESSAPQNSFNIIKDILSKIPGNHQIESYLQSFINSDEMIQIYPETTSTHQLWSFDLKLLKNLLLTIFETWGTAHFRYSQYNNEPLNNISIFLPLEQVHAQINKFFLKCKQLSVPIYYKDSPLKIWELSPRINRKDNSQDWFDLNVELTPDDYQILKNLNEKNFFSHNNNGLILFDPDQKDLVKFLGRILKPALKKKKTLSFLQSLQPTLENSLAKETLGPDIYSDEQNQVFNLQVPYSRGRIFELFELYKMGFKEALRPEELKLCLMLGSLTEIPTYSKPELLFSEPRSYQIKGYNWLRFLHENKLGALLADDMGLGKTLQIIMFLNSIIDQVKRVLIVCPVSILINWQKEFEKFSALKVSIYYSSKRNLQNQHTSDLKNLPNDSKIILTSYGVMKKEIEHTLKDMAFDILILDEVQQIKNHKSLGANAARKIKAQFRICLTGTPVENHIVEFYNILDLSIPGIWSSWEGDTQMPKKEEIAWAKKMSRPFILRRTKNQVLQDLPEKISQQVFLEFSPQERAHYKQALLQIRYQIQKTPYQKRYGEILRGLLELRKLCLWQNFQLPNHKIKNTPEAQNRLIEQISENHLLSTKINFLLENVEQILNEGHQAIIFSQFTTYLDIIQNRFNEHKFKYSRIDGQQSIHTRQKQVDLFQKGETPLFLISLKAGGFGLNLTAASYVFLMDPWWNPAVENQAIDRAHRIGQKNKLTVYRPLIKDSVEEKVLSLQEQKKELFQNLLEDQNEQIFKGHLTMSDFEALLGDA
jgi:SNF2 family DNA or RNA helicase